MTALLIAGCSTSALSIFNNMQKQDKIDENRLLCKEILEGLDNLNNLLTEGTCKELVEKDFKSAYEVLKCREDMAAVYNDYGRRKKLCEMLIEAEDLEGLSEEAILSIRKTVIVYSEASFSKYKDGKIIVPGKKKENALNVLDGAANGFLVYSIGAQVAGIIAGAGTTAAAAITGGTTAAIAATSTAAAGTAVATTAGTSVATTGTAALATVTGVSAGVIAAPIVIATGIVLSGVALKKYCENKEVKSILEEAIKKGELLSFNSKSEIAELTETGISEVKGKENMAIKAIKAGRYDKESYEFFKFLLTEYKLKGETKKMVSVLANQLNFLHEEQKIDRKVSTVQ